MEEQQPIDGGAPSVEEQHEQRQSAGGQQTADSAYKEPSGLDNFKAWAGDLFAQASEVILRPGDFFGEIPREGGTGRATVFAIVMGFLAGVLGFVLRVLPPFSSVFKLPFAAFAGTVVGAFLVHVLAMLAGGKGSLEASYRLAAYLMVFLPLIIVADMLPYLHIAMGGYALYALIQGVIPVHGLEERRAWSVFGAAGVAILVLGLLGTVAGPC
jgi:hypothetical protein